jgi:hypothetical protein
MITLEKLKEYEEYHGFYDGFYIQKVKKGTNISSDADWILIRNLIEDIRLVTKGLASKEFAINLDLKLKENCANKATLHKIKKLTENDW